MAPRKPKSVTIAPVAMKPVPASVEVSSPAEAGPVAETMTEAVAATVQPADELNDAMEAAVAQGAELQENVRRLAEQTLAQTRDAYDQIRVAAEEATGSLEASYTAAANGFKEMQGVALQAFRANAVATIEHFKAIIAARDLADAMKLQSEHMTRQIEAVSTQVRDFGELAKKVGADTAEPLKTTFGRSFGVAA